MGSMTSRPKIQPALQVIYMPSPATPNYTPPAAGSGASDEKDLQAMMRDPKYWRDKDPAYVAKVTDGFQRMYGSN